MPCREPSCLPGLCHMPLVQAQSCALTHGVEMPVSSGVSELHEGRNLLLILIFIIEPFTSISGIILVQSQLSISNDLMTPLFIDSSSNIYIFDGYNHLH